MPAIMTPLSPAQVAAFAAGDESAFEHVVRTRFDALVEKAGLQLGPDAPSAPRVAMSVLLGAWTDREHITTPAALDAYLDDAVPHRCAEEQRRRASLHRFELHEGVHVSSPNAKSGMTADEAWQEIDRRLHVSAEELAEHREESRRLARRHAREHVDRVSNRKLPVGMIAVGVLLVAAVVFGMRWMDRGSAELALTRALEAEDVRTLRAAPGQRGTIELLDASTAQLGAGTTLRIPRGFGTAVRGLELDGASHFVVAPDNALDFQVRVRNSAIIATGTAFSVRAYEEDADLFISVREGTVRVHPVLGEAASTSLNAGESLVVTNDGSTRTPTAQELTLAFSWIDGELTLDDVTVDQAVKMLSRWHNLNTNLADPALGQRRITTKLPLESSGQALDALTRAANLVVTYEGEQMVLRDAAAAAPPAARRR